MVVPFGNTSSRKLETSEKQLKLPICMAQLVNVEGLVGKLHFMIVTKTELLVGSALIVDMHGSEYKMNREEWVDAVLCVAFFLLGFILMKVVL
jgi:hypothetical protein